MGVLFVHAAWFALRGFRSSTSWFCLVFAFGMFTSSLFSFPAAFMGSPDHVWLLGLEASSKYLELGVASATAFWVGHLLSKKQAKLFARKLVVPALRLDEHRIDNMCSIFSYAGAVVSLGASIFGRYGYFIEKRYLENPSLFMTLLEYFLDIAILLSFVVFISTYRRAGSLQTRHYFLIAIWILAGILAGFKGQVVYPIVLVFIAAWITKRVSVFHYGAILLFVFVAYAIVEPMREIAQESSFAVDAGDAFLDVIDTNFIEAENASDVAGAFMNRLDYSADAVRVLQADGYGYLEDYKNKVREQYELLPLLTFVPRFVWPEKPLQDLGRQLSIAIFGNSRNSITPTSRVASYLAGGLVFTIVTSMVFGAVVTMSGAILNKYAAHPTKYLPVVMLAFSLSIGETYFSSYLIQFARLVLLTYFVYFLMRMFGMTSRTPKSRYLSKRIKA